MPPSTSMGLPPTAESSPADLSGLPSIFDTAAATYLSNAWLVAGAKCTRILICARSVQGKANTTNIRRILLARATGGTHAPGARYSSGVGPGALQSALRSQGQQQRSGAVVRSTLPFQGCAQYLSIERSLEGSRQGWLLSVGIRSTDR